MGFVCEFYRIDDETIDQFLKNPIWADHFIAENYRSVSGQYYIEDDTAFSIDKAWDIARFLLQQCDSSPQKDLTALYGETIDKTCLYTDCLRYIKSQKVEKIHLALSQISTECIMKVYDRDKMIEDEVYRADWWDVIDWKYILSHTQTIKNAFAKANEQNEGIIVDFY